MNMHKQLGMLCFLRLWINWVGRCRLIQPSGSSGYDLSLAIAAICMHITISASVMDQDRGSVVRSKVSVTAYWVAKVWRNTSYVNSMPKTISIWISFFDLNQKKTQRWWLENPPTLALIQVQICNPSQVIRGSHIQKTNISTVYLVLGTSLLTLTFRTPL